MDEYTFIAEDAAAADAAGAAPAIQQVSPEQLYRNELAEEMQVWSCHTYASLQASSKHWNSCSLCMFTLYAQSRCLSMTHSAEHCALVH